MARIEVRLPQWGMGMQEGIVGEWLKQEGETVAADDDLVEIEAAKTNEVVPSPATGRLVSIFHQEGETVPVREVLAIIETDD